MIPTVWGFFHRAGGGLITCPWNKVIFRGIAPALLIFSMYPEISWSVLPMMGAFWLGNAIMGYSDHWFMENLEDWIYMTFRGLLFTIFPAIILCFFDTFAGFILALSGLFFGVSYWIGKHWNNTSPGMMQGPECSEFVFGFLLGSINYAFYLTKFA